MSAPFLKVSTKIFLFKSGFTELMKPNVSKDFCVALEHIEQVNPVTCKSAVDICCAEALTAKKSIIMLNNFIVFMIFLNWN
ncbi:hypothetical protein D3C72_2143910 [compost metagenome]